MPLLIVTCSEIKLSQRFLVREERFSLGRSRSSAVPLRDKSVSKSHVMVSRTPTGYFFQDLFSANGTFLNEERRDSGLLKDGDVLRLGKVNVTFLFREEIDGAGEGGEPAARRDPSRLPEPSPGQSAPRPLQEAPRSGLPPRAESGRAFMDRELARLARRRRRILAASGIGVAAFLLGFLAGRIDELSSPERSAAGPEGPGSSIAKVDSPPASSLVEETKEVAPPEDRETMEEEAPDPREEERIEEIAGEYRDGLLRPPADLEESRRVLFRLFLDLLDRPPTRAEAKELLAQDHAQRWRRISGMARSEPGPKEDGGGAGARGGNEKGKAPGAVEESFQRFLGRLPDPSEARAFERGIFRGTDPASVEDGPGNEPLPAGLILTASSEYRSAGLRREKSLRQKAGALIVDLLDRPPASAEEVLEVEKALDEFPQGKIARLLALSPEGTRALAVPATGGDPSSGKIGAREGSAEELKGWAREEIFRFLLRSPTDEELEKVMADVRKGSDGPLRLRIALAGLAEYRSF